MIKKRLSAVIAAALLTFTPVCSGVKNTVLNFNSVQTSAAEYQKNTEGFVTRMYKVVLNRNPDPTGLKNWTNKLNNHTATASDLIYGFFNSDEYKGRKKSNDQIITDCYNAMLDRNPDASGKNTWGSRLNIGMTPMAVCKGFAGSNEFKGLCAEYGITVGNIPINYARDENYERTYFVYRLYKNCLGRTPDVTGLENWCRNLKNGTTGTKIAQGFIFSNEYKNRITKNDEFVDMLYRTILGRSSDKNGAATWTNKLNYTNTREYVTNGFIFSDEFKGQCAKAGISVGKAIATKDDSPEWKLNVSSLEYINKKRAERGVHALVLQQDVWERYASVLAKQHSNKSKKYINFCDVCKPSSTGVLTNSLLYRSCKSSLPYIAQNVYSIKEWKELFVSNTYEMFAVGWSSVNDPSEFLSESFAFILFTY